MTTSPGHRDLILDQFTRQAMPFSTSPEIADEATLRLIVEWSGAGPEDTLLDVACGAGHVVCAFARSVRHATGIDLTPAMLERARALQEECGLTNVSWRQGDVLPLPFAEAVFSLVTARYAFHHFPDPGAVDVIHEILEAALVDDRLGIPVRREGGRIHVSYPVAVLAAKRSA